MKLVERIGRTEMNQPNRKTIREWIDTVFAVLFGASITYALVCDSVAWCVMALIALYVRQRVLVWILRDVLEGVDKNFGKLKDYTTFASSTIIDWVDKRTAR